MTEVVKAFIKIHGATEIGTVRKVNEDKFSFADLRANQILTAGYDGAIGKEGFLMLVSDGSGGDGRGEVASSLAVHVFQEEILHRKSNSFGELLMKAARVANDMVFEQSQRNPGISGMAATLTAALVVPPLVYIIEVGDSRCYLVRGRAIKQITRDQSMAQLLLDAGVVTLDALSTHPYRNIVLQSLGVDKNVQPVVTSLEIARGDRLLICSDGLSKYLSTDQMLDVMDGCEDLAQINQRLIERALEMKTDDNITVVLAALSGDAFSPPETLSQMVIVDSADESEEGDLPDLTDIISPVE